MDHSLILGSPPFSSLSQGWVVVLLLVSGGADRFHQERLIMLVLQLLGTQFRRACILPAFKVALGLNLLDGAVLFRL
jgi:hypothetical protein